MGIGEMAALVTAAGWAGSCHFQTLVGRRVGTLNLMAARCPLLVAGAALVVLATGTGTAVAPGALPFILVSGVIGLAISDPLLFSASVSIGPRLALLIQSLSACITALFGYVFFGETISALGWAGILVASAGVAFVLMEGGLRHGGIDFSGLSRAQILIGVGKGLLSAFAVSSSYLLLKQGLLIGIEPVWSTFIRISVGGGAVCLFMALRGRLFAAFRATWTSWPFMRLLLTGCCISTVGNCLAPVAMKYTQAGIAATLIGLQPIMIIIIVACAERKVPSARAIAGTLIACAGTALIFMR